MTITVERELKREDLWSHPTLDLFNREIEEVVQRPRLYLAPTTFGEEFDRDDHPRPTSAAELPDITRWISIFSISLLEIWTGRRQPAQLSAKCHRVIYNNILRNVGSLKSSGKVMTLYVSEPLDGICEASITISFGERVRVLAIRCEGVDGRWLCTALRLI